MHTKPCKRLAHDASPVIILACASLLNLASHFMEVQLIINPDPTTVDYEIEALAVLAEGEMLYVGIDVGKESHHVGLMSKSLLAKHRRFDKCPVSNFPNSREGFDQLLEALRAYAPLGRCVCLKETTGHYGHALGEYLQKQGVTVYTMHVFKRALKNKTDKRDALNLANTAYNQLELDKQPGDTKEQIHHEVPASEAARKLRVLVQRKTELTVDITVRKNRLTAIADEVFPELTEIFVDPNRATALNIREKFPTPAAVVAASMKDLLACRTHTRPSTEGMQKLKDLAAQSIGITDEARLYGLVLEQGQLISELREMQKNLDILETEITAIVEDCREGKILMSTGFIGTMNAAAIIASIGSIARFENPGRLRAFAGWSPNQTQTGTSKDAMALNKGGNKVLKQAIFMATFNALKTDTQLKTKYERLVLRKCNLDLRTGKYVGRMKCVGRICGDVLTLVYVLLKKDYDLLQSLPPGKTPPDPGLYSRELHKKHCLRGKGEVPPVATPIKGIRSEKVDRLCELLAQDPGIKVGELAELAGVSRKTAGKMRKQWLEENLFKQQAAKEVHETAEEIASASTEVIPMQA